MAKVCVMVPGNVVGGGVKMPVRLASHLAPRHDVTIVYPRIAQYTLRHRLRESSLLSKLRHVAGQARMARREFVWASDCEARVRVAKYFIDPPPNFLNGFDAIIYPSPWQYHELNQAGVNGPKRIHWSLADYFFCSGIGEPLDRLLEAYLSSDVLVAPSSRTRSDLERYGARVAAVIGGGIDDVFTDTGRESSSGPPRVLGYFQPAWWVKGAATLLQVFRELRLRYPELPLEMFGHQPSGIAAARSGLADRFYSGLPSREVAALLRRTDVFVYPSYSDGFPSPPLEAMACGCAVASTRVGAVEEYSTDGATALLCDPMDANALLGVTERLVQDASLRCSLQRAAPIAARKWRWEDCAREFEKLITD